jgi:hypothetical protein
VLLEEVCRFPFHAMILKQCVWFQLRRPDMLIQDWLVSHIRFSALVLQPSHDTTGAQGEISRGLIRPTDTRKSTGLHWRHRNPDLSSVVSTTKCRAALISGSSKRASTTPRTSFETILHVEFLEMSNIEVASALSSKNPPVKKRRGGPKVRTGCKTCKPPHELLIEIPWLTECRQVCLRIPKLFFHADYKPLMR